MSSLWIEEALVGKKIVGVRVKSPSVWLHVEGGGWIEINVKGDCCSAAYIDASKLYGMPILSGEYVEIDLPAQSTVQEVDNLTAIRFEGMGGFLAILHRNSSNGYYGNFLTVSCDREPPTDAVDGKLWHREVYTKDTLE